MRGDSDRGFGQNRPIILQRKSKAVNQLRQHDLRLRDGEPRAYANSWPAAERDEGARSSPGRWIILEAPGHERGRMFPEAAVTVENPRADPDLRSSPDLLFAYDVVLHRQAR